VGTLGYIDYLFKGYSGPLNPDQMDQLGSARDSAIQLQRTIDVLFDVIAFDLKLIRLSSEKVDLAKFLKALFSELKGWVQEEGRSLTFKGTQQSVFVQLDRTWVRVLIGELLSNAVRVSPEGGQVKVRLRKVDKAVQIEIVDQGPGVAPNRLSWIFQPMTQLSRDGDPNPGDRGGLGLALAAQIVYTHKGRIWAEAVPDDGLKIIVELPLDNS